MIPAEKLLFEISRKGRKGPWFEDAAHDEKAPLGLEASALREDIEGFPELSEIDVLRHYTRLSKWNYGVEDGMYPLGSCTMKYNPKLNEDAARLTGFADLHPLQPDCDVQAALEMMARLEDYLCAITGFEAATLQPAAGAHGELTGLLMIRACLESRGDARKKVLIPDSAHGTNPASATLAGYASETVPSGPDGRMDVEALKGKLDSSVAAMMVTNPNTLGVFESRIAEAADLLHRNGSLLYMDGANMNALMGWHRPGDAGVDVLHLNLHKTFSTPHGGGGPGSGPVMVQKDLIPFLPVPRVKRLGGGGFAFDFDAPRSIGRVRAFYGNFGMFVRAYAYIRALGREGLKQSTEDAVLNANYLRARLKDDYDLPYATASMHEVVFSDRIQRERGVSALDVAKRLLDLGFHPPTVYFPLIVKGALMIEPTESVGVEELERFAAAMKQIAREARESPQILKDAPARTPVRRLDEVKAAKEARLRWRPV
jgi:glycine dehydrogenase subunit 2